MTDNSASLLPDDKITIPEEKYAPKPVSVLSYRKKQINICDDDSIVSKAKLWVQAYLHEFRAQNQWDTYRKKIDTFDEMYRAAVNRTQLNTDESGNVDNTRSNVKSASFYADLRAITAAEKTAILGEAEDVPGVYSPVQGASEYQEKEGLAMAEYWNAILFHTLEVDDMRDKIGQALWSVNKYGNVLAEMGWALIQDEMEERVPIEFEIDEEGYRRPTAFEYKKKLMTIRDNPTFTTHDIKDCYFDAMIDDIQQQSCIITRKQMQLGEIWLLQKSGIFKNVGKINKSMQYSGEGYNSDKNNRQTNAGESGDADSPTSLFDVWTTYVRLPVEIKNDKGTWSPEKIVPHWFRAVWIGNLESGGECQCVLLEPNPLKSKKVPIVLIHSHDDDKGAIHMGYGDLVKSIIAQEMTTFDQHIDNVRLANNAPWIVDRGSLSIRDKVFTAGHNQIFYKTPGSQDPHILQIQDRTGQTLNMLGTLKEMRREVMGLNKALIGEAMGSRTSAREATIAFEQGMKPALEDAKYKANQILGFIGFWVRELWEQFGDPDRQIRVTYKDQPVEVNPSKLWGPMSFRVVSVQNFQDNLIERQALDKVMQTLMPMMMPVMSAEGQIKIFKQVLKYHHVQDVENIWKIDSDFDARHVAKSENFGILVQGVYDMPKEGEKHESHIPEHKSALATYMLVPKEERNEQNVNIMKQHIMTHEKMIEQAKAQAQQAQTPPNAESPDGQPGGVEQDMMAGYEGAMENPPVMPQG